MNSKINRLPDAEFEIMKVIWSNETPISTSQIKTYLDRKRPWNISALQTLLNRLIDRGFLSTNKQGKNRIYEPLIPEKKYLALENRTFFEKLNDNSITKLVASLVDSDALTSEDLAELKAFIEQKTRGD